MLVRVLSLLLPASTFVLLLIGGTVNPTGSSLACPDWPLCYGEVFPEMVGGVRFEHAHRMAATVVGLLAVALALAVRRRDDLPWRGRLLAGWLVVLVVAQGILGGVTVLLRLPTLVSTAHLALSMAFFLLTVTAAHWLAQPARHAAEPALARAPALVALLAVYAQIVLGGFVRHVGAGRACGTDVPLCGGSLWPDRWIERTHQLHRGAGVLVLLVGIAASAILVRRAARGSRRVGLAAIVAGPILACAQVALGVITVTSGVGLAEVMAHFTGAVLLLLCWHVAYLGLGPRAVARVVHGNPALAVGAAT